MAAAGAPAAPPAAPAAPAAQPARARPGDLAALGKAPPPTVDLDAPSPFAGQDGSDDIPLPSGQPTLEGEAEPGAEPDLEVLTEEPPAEDDADPDAAPLFGQPPAEIMKMLRAGQIPEAMLDTVYSDVPIVGDDGQTRVVRMTMNEMRRGVMLRADYSRKTAEAANIKKQALNVMQQRQAEMQQLDDPRGFRAWVEQNGKGDAFYQAAQELAREVQAYKQMSPEQQRAYDHEQVVRQREADLVARERDTAARQAQYDFQQRQQKYAQDLGAMVPQAFAKLKIQDSKLAQQIFTRELGQITGALERFDVLTQQMVDDAAIATLETLRDLNRYGDAPAAHAAANAAAAQQQRGGNGAPPVTALPGARQPGAPRPSREFRGTIGDLSPLRKSR